MNFKLLPIALLTSAFILPASSASANPVNWSIDQDQISLFQVVRPKPAGATRQWMRFWFISHGLMTTSRHVAVGLRGTITLGTAPSGRGITIGHTNANLAQQDLYGPEQLYLYPERTHGGCLADLRPNPDVDPQAPPLELGWNPMAGARPGQSQVEIFYPTGNRLYQSSCAPHMPIINTSFGPYPDRSKGLQDGQWYRYNIEVTNAGQVRFQISDTAGNLLANSVVEDGWNPAAIDGITQWIGISDGSGMAQSLCTTTYCEGSAFEPYWSLNVTQIEGGWN